VSRLGRLLGRRKKWDASWASFPGTIDDRPAVWLVDLGAVDAAPVDHLPVRVDVTAWYAPDVETGLPQSDQLPYLDAVGEALTTTAQAAGGAMVGRVSSNGATRFTAHLPGRPTRPPAFPPGGPRPPELVTELDPLWAYVRDALTPDERQQAMVEDLAVVLALREQGDDLTTSRPIEFVAIFPVEEQARAAGRELNAAGHAVSVDPDDEGGYVLTATTTANVVVPRLHELTWSVADTVHRHGGNYDGWSCPVMAG
jgi:regulator of ribonuclease activity B/uncharacterized protein DUF695